MMDNSRLGRTRLRRVIALALLGLVAALLPATLPSSTVAPSSAAVANSTIFGVAVGPGNAPTQVTVQLFNSQWTYLAQTRSTKGGVFRFSRLPAGSYFLQASDNRKTYDIHRLARTDASVSVGTSQSAQRNIVMRRGAFVTGVVKVGKKGKPAGRATVRVASQYGASYTTVADNRGRFAVGGLPGGQKYSVFAWDRKKAYAGRSIWLGRLKATKGRNVVARLKVRASAYAGILRVNGVPTGGTIWATAVSRATGQWWTAPIPNGDLSYFRGLYPGPYVLQLPETTQIVAQSLAMPAVPAGRTRLITLNARALPPCPPPTATATTTATAHATATVTATLYPAARIVPCPTKATVKETTTATATVTATQTICPSPSATVTATANATVTATTTATATVVLPAQQAARRAAAACPATATATVTNTTTATARATTTVTVTPAP